MPLKKHLKNRVNGGDDIIDFDFLKIRNKTIFSHCCWDIHDLSCSLENSQ
jgi:hypothetical protein